MLRFFSIKKALFGVLLLHSFLSAEFILDDYFAWTEVNEPIARMQSVSWRTSYITGGMDHWLQASVVWELTAKLYAGATASVNIMGEGINPELSLKYHLRGNLHRSTYRDYLLINGGPWWLNSVWDPACGYECSSWELIWSINGGYGRDLLFWDSATWGLRFEFLIGSTLGGTVNRLSTGIFGIPETKSGHLLLELRGGVFWF